MTALVALPQDPPYPAGAAEVVEEEAPLPDVIRGCEWLSWLLATRICYDTSKHRVPSSVLETC